MQNQNRTTCKFYRCKWSNDWISIYFNRLSPALIVGTRPLNFAKMTMRTSVKIATCRRMRTIRKTACQKLWAHMKGYLFKTGPWTLRTVQNTRIRKMSTIAIAASKSIARTAWSTPKPTKEINSTRVSNHKLHHNYFCTDQKAISKEH